mmetsp:Transcript_3222/g.4831  ORF Transcript_3222/g.4831 Transcript_3222/m.4831 type:complete len:379 (-) Transcript_3222:886-2022(-)
MTEAAAVVNINVTTEDSVQEVSTTTTTTMAMTPINSANDAKDDSVKVSTTMTIAPPIDADNAYTTTSHDTVHASSSSALDNDNKACPSNADATAGDLTRSNYDHFINHPVKDNHHPQVTPCSLNPAYWSKRRIRVTTIGCLTSCLVCIVRLLVNHDSTAYIIHSFIIFFDLILIHIFTYTPWLSIAGESTAIVFATTYYFTHERIFELLETTLIAVFVSIHMIQSRDEHWGREEGLERDVIGLQLHIEQFLVQHDVNRDDQLRRYSSVSMVDEHGDDTSDPAVEEVDLEVGGDASNAHLDVLSSINSTINAPAYYNKVDLRRQQQLPQEVAELGNKSSRVWKVAFDHFLDGSAGVLYTSFFGLILDEIVNFGTDKYQK